MILVPPFTVKSSLPRLRTTSPGEELWFALRDMYATDPDGKYPGAPLFDLTSWVEPSGAFAHYQADVTVTSAVFKLMKAAKRVEDRDGLGGNALYTDEGKSIFLRGITRYLVEQMGFSALDSGAHRLLPHLVFLAHSKTRADIGKDARSETLDDASRYFSDANVHCYCCHTVLWSQSFPTKTGIALDHLWPRSLGGVSTARNLLPICEECNGAKEDRASWSVFGVVQDYSQAARNADANLLLSLALHQRAANQLATQSYLSLKEAYISLGPRVPLELVDQSDGDHFFNRIAHDNSKLPSLW